MDVTEGYEIGVVYQVVCKEDSFIGEKGEVFRCKLRNNEGEEEWYISNGEWNWKLDKDTDGCSYGVLGCFWEMYMHPPTPILTMSDIEVGDKLRCIEDWGGFVKGHEYLIIDHNIPLCDRFGPCIANFKDLSYFVKVVEPVEEEEAIELVEVIGWSFIDTDVNFAQLCTDALESNSSYWIAEGEKEAYVGSLYNSVPGESVGLYCLDISDMDYNRHKYPYQILKVKMKDISKWREILAAFSLKEKEHKEALKTKILDRKRKKEQNRFTVTLF